MIGSLPTSLTGLADISYTEYGAYLIVVLAAIAMIKFLFNAENKPLDWKKMFKKPLNDNNSNNNNDDVRIEALGDSELGVGESSDRRSMRRYEDNKNGKS